MKLIRTRVAPDNGCPRIVQQGEYSPHKRGDVGSNPTTRTGTGQGEPDHSPAGMVQR